MRVSGAILAVTKPTGEIQMRFGGSVPFPGKWPPLKYPNVMLIYIYARKRVGDEGYLEGPTPLLSSLLRSPPGPREAIFRVDLEEPKKVYTSFNGKWIKVK